MADRQCSSLRSGGESESRGHGLPGVFGDILRLLRLIRGAEVGQPYQ